MLKVPGVIKKLGVGAAICGSLAIAVGTAQAATPFQVDVSTSIDRGIEWLANQGAFTGGAGDATGIAMEALLEKRASGNPLDPPQGYNGASAADQARLRSAATYIINSTAAQGAGFYAYRDGSRMFALAGYALTGGPDKSVLGTTINIKQAMDILVNRTLANQRKAPLAAIDQGYWCYTDNSCMDSSTTQFAAAGLQAARTFYQSPNSGDVPFLDAPQATLVAAALTLAKQAYEMNAGTGSDNGSCNVLTATERGHGYHTPREGYKPSLQQTASGIYIQLFGGSNINTPMVQQYMEWIRDRYRYTDLDSMGNFWPANSWSYYMWSSFKGMELLRQAGVPPAAGNLGPDSYGTLPAASAPACNQRQEHKDPATVARPASFGAGGAGFYSAETKSQYFDYASEILSKQCYDGSLPINGGDGGYFCNGIQNPWEQFSHQAYLLLVLQRSTGNVVQACDVDGDHDVDTDDLALIRSGISLLPAPGDPRDANLDGKITMNDVRFCTLRCTRASCATH